MISKDPVPQGRVFLWNNNHLNHMIKHSIFTALLLAAFTTLFAQNETTHNVTTPIRSVIIYLDGAEIAQSKQVNLEDGRNKVVFTGLSASLIPKSLQATATGGVTILAVSDQVNYMSKQAESARVKTLKDSVLLISDNIAKLRAERDAYDNEKQMILANKEIGGSDKGVAIAELKLAADFYRARLKEINSEVLRIDTKVTQLNETLSKANMQLTSLNAKATQPTAEVTVLIASTGKVTSTIELRYLVKNAGWQPSYDLRAEDVDKPIQLTYRAKVYNNTGVDWNDVKVKLSTADPNKSASKPELETWNLDFDQGIYYKNSTYSNGTYQQQSQNDGYLNAPSVYENSTTYDKKQTQQVQLEQIQVSELSAEFDIKTNYTIPADSKPYIVEVTTYNLPASYQHFSIPKTDRDAFLLARITGWEDLDLVEGPANVYYAGTYIGQSYIYTRSVDDTLALSLGRDNKVIVTRTKLKDLTSVKSIGSTKKETYAYEMVVKNNRKAPITIEIQDQLPVSKQSDIEVETIETSKAELDVPTGKLKWNLTLAPGESKKISLSFSIKYPKTKSIQTRKYKTRSAPKF
jgi:uncharacterized protein (TIGR02231 family)